MDLRLRHLARPVNVLLGCESSGRVRDEFLARGHDAWSCDLKPIEGSRAGNHIQGDLLEVLRTGWFEGHSVFSGKTGRFYRQWDVLIAFPPCTYLAGSGIHWNRRRPGRAAQTDEASAFFREIADASVPRICIENPVGVMSTRWREPDQIVQPYEFGEDASKATCLWLKNLPRLRRRKRDRVDGRFVARADGTFVERWSNQTDGGQNKLPPSAERAAERARTYVGIARAMAEQWDLVWTLPLERSPKIQPPLFA